MAKSEKQKQKRKAKAKAQRIQKQKQAVNRKYDNANMGVSFSDDTFNLSLLVSATMGIFEEPLCNSSLKKLAKTEEQYKHLLKTVVTKEIIYDALNDNVIFAYDMETEEKVEPSFFLLNEPIAEILDFVILEFTPLASMFFEFAFNDRLKEMGVNIDEIEDEGMAYQLPIFQTMLKQLVNPNSTDQDPSSK